MRPPREVSAQPPSAVAGRGRRGAGRRRLGPVLVRPLRRRLPPALLRPLPRLGRRRPRRRDHAPGLHRLRLLQPLVAVRLDAGHVGRASRRRERRDRGVPRLRAARLPPGEGAARDLDRRPPAPPRVRHGRTAHGALADRAPVRPDARRPREGGADRRSRRRLSADPPRDAAEPRARLHADRARGRRSPEEEPPAARGARAWGRRTSYPRSCATGGPTSSSSRSRRRRATCASASSRPPARQASR